MALTAPSILSADFADLLPSLKMLEKAGTDMIHIDVMDGVFVPNISMGFPVIKCIGNHTDIPLDVHMMTIDASRYIEEAHASGAAIMTVHVEACTHLHRTLQQIKAKGMKAGVALNPATPLVILEEILDDVDIVMLMSVNPGFSGQSFIESSIEKVRRLRAMIDERGSKTLIEVDGGINEFTGREVVDAGADILVAGNYVFKSENPVEAINKLQSIQRR